MSFIINNDISFQRVKHYSSLSIGAHTHPYRAILLS